MKKILTTPIFIFALLLCGCAPTDDQRGSNRAIDWPRQCNAITFDINSPNTVEVEFTADQEWKAVVYKEGGQPGEGPELPLKVFPESGPAGRNTIRIEYNSAQRLPGTSIVIHLAMLRRIEGEWQTDKPEVEVPVTIVQRKRVHTITYNYSDEWGVEEPETYTLVYDDAKGGILTKLAGGDYDIDFDYSTTALSVKWREDHDIPGNYNASDCQGELSVGRLTEMFEIYTEAVADGGTLTENNAYTYSYGPITGRLLSATVDNSWIWNDPDNPAWGGFETSFDFIWESSCLQKIETLEQIYDGRDYPITFHYTNACPNNLNIDLWPFIVPFSRFQVLPMVAGYMGERSAYLPSGYTDPKSTMTVTCTKDGQGYPTRIVCRQTATTEGWWTETRYDITYED